MNCAQAKSLFDAYLNDELQGSMATEFNAHRLSCAECRRELALLEVAGHVIASDNEAPLLDDEFTDRLLSLAEEAPSRRTVKMRWWLPAGVTAAAACLALFLIPTFFSSTTPTKPEGPAVAGERVTVEDIPAMLEQIERAREANPNDPKLNNPDLRAFEDRLRASLNDVGEKADTVEKLGLDAFREILRSQQRESAGATDNERAEDQEGGAVSTNGAIEDL